MGKTWLLTTYEQKLQELSCVSLKSSGGMKTHNWVIQYSSQNNTPRRLRQEKKVPVTRKKCDCPYNWDSPSSLFCMTSIWDLFSHTNTLQSFSHWSVYYSGAFGLRRDVHVQTDWRAESHGWSVHLLIYNSFPCKWSSHASKPCNGPPLHWNTKWAKIQAMLSC